MIPIKQPQSSTKRRIILTVLIVAALAVPGLVYAYSDTRWIQLSAAATLFVLLITGAIILYVKYGGEEVSEPDEKQAEPDNDTSKSDEQQPEPSNEEPETSQMTTVPAKTTTQEKSASPDAPPKPDRAPKPPTPQKAEDDRLVGNLRPIKRLLVWSLILTIFIPFAVSQQVDWQLGVMQSVLLLAALIVVEWCAPKVWHFIKRIRHKLFGGFRRHEEPPREKVEPLEPEHNRYDERPHFTQFAYSIVWQTLLWAVILAGGIYLAPFGHDSFLWNIYVQFIVTQVNVYIIARSYVKWATTFYITTKKQLEMIRQENLFFAIFRASRQTIEKRTLVGSEQLRRTPLEHLLFKQRGRVLIKTQDGKKPEFTLSYVLDPDRFVKSLSER